MSLTSEIKIGVLFGRCSAGMQALTTWALLVVPAGVPLRGPDMSWDMRLSGVSIETPDSDESEPMAVGLSVPLGLDGTTDAESTAAYVAPTPDGPGCQLQEEVCSPVAVTVAGGGEGPGAGRLLVGSIDSPALASSLAFRFPEVLVPIPDSVQLLPVGTAGLFFVFLRNNIPLSVLLR